MNILSFDIEEWFHILANDSTRTQSQWDGYEERIYRNMDRIFALLDASKVSATFFCLGWIARKYPDIIRRIDDLGYEIGTHSDLHQLVYEQGKNEYKRDLERSIKSLEDLIGKKVRAYRAPGFSIKNQNKWAFEMLVEAGIEIDCSVFPAKRAHGGFSDFGDAAPCYISIEGHLLKEFPISPKKVFDVNIVFSGGGYFRLFPYNFIKSCMSKSSYVMTYFHPRDFDPEQPVIPELNLIRKFKSYYGLNACYNKLQHLLQENNFMDLRTADLAVDWSTVPVKNL